MSLLAGILALLPVWLLGALMLGAAGLRRDDATDLPLDFATGVAALGLVGTLLIVFGVPLSPLVGYVLLLFAGLFAWRGGVRPRVRLPDVPSDRVARLLLGAALAVLVMLPVAALHDRLSWDGWAIWVLKARILFLDGVFPGDFWNRPGPFDFAHADYPLALPLLDWWLFEHARAAAPALASFAGGVWFALLVWLLWSGAALRGQTGRWTAAATLGLAVFWPISYFAVGGTADVVMALVFLGVTVELQQAVATEARRPLLRAIVYLALGALTKNEGLAAALVGGGVVAMVAFRHVPAREAMRIAAMAAVPFAIGLGWRMWSGGMGAGVEQLGGSFDVRSILDSAVVVAEGIARLALYREWPPLVLILAIGIWRWRRHGLRTQNAAWSLLGVYLAVALGVYLTTEQDLVWLLETSLGRVVSALVPAALLLTVMGLAHPSDNLQENS